MLNMNPREYCIWLQGYLEAAGNNLSEAQVQTIKNRLDNIFEHVAEKPKERHYFRKTHTVTKPPVDPSKVLYRC
jgi:hypothetical protein